MHTLLETHTTCTLCLKHMAHAHTLLDAHTTHTLLETHTTHTFLNAHNMHVTRNTCHTHSTCCLIQTLEAGYLIPSAGMQTGVIHAMISNVVCFQECTGVGSNTHNLLLICLGCKAPTLHWNETTSTTQLDWQQGWGWYLQDAHITPQYMHHHA